MQNKIIYFFTLVLFFTGCDDASVSCNDKIMYSDTKNSAILPPYVSEYLHESLFITENTREACHTYALNYIQSYQYQYEKYYYGDQCHAHILENSLSLRLYYKRVLQTDSKLIDQKASLSLQEVEDYVQTYCNLDYGEPPKNLTKFEVKNNNQLYFEYVLNNQIFSGELSTYDLNLACPLYSLQCYTYPVQIQEASK